MNIKREVAFTNVSLGVVTTSLAFFLLTFLERREGAFTGWHSAEAFAFLAIVLLLTFCNLIYLSTRLGYLRRRAAHHPAPREILEAIYDRSAPRLGILIPSYKEEERVLLQTILSVALLEYPLRRVVVLIDDPPDATGADLAALQGARALIKHLNETFAAHGRLLQREHLSFLTRARIGLLDLPAESSRVAGLYEKVAEWLDQWAETIMASSTTASAHTDRLFVEEILRRPASDHRARTDRLRFGAFDSAAIAREYRRLVILVTVEIESFERKRYVNLSHQPNKAMNLNSYIGMIGRSLRDDTRADGLHLVECAPEEATVSAPPVDFLLTIDADSVVLSDYALRLVHIMEHDSRLAVAQTPYSAFPHAPGLLERVAGATTDIQYVIHQGFTRFNATYWVGANATLRLTALRDICKFVEERGHRISVFIQDRTLIEDTGSTVDLIRRGWRLYNYPERLAYSATPPDFGALIIQRRRWSNGGLLILPDLVRYLWKSGRLVRCLPETAMRAYYLCSPAVANFGLLALLLYRFEDSLTNLWLPLIAAPYYFLYGRDLGLAGYRWADLLRVYALNLLLIPVNLAGVLRSLQQALTGRKAAFGRTPKVQRRTFTQPVYVVFHGLLLAYLVTAFTLDLMQGLYSHAGFALATTGFYLYAITHFLGWQESYADLNVGLTRWWHAVWHPLTAYPSGVGSTPLARGTLNSNVEVRTAALEKRRTTT